MNLPKPSNIKHMWKRVAQKKLQQASTATEDGRRTTKRYSIRGSTPPNVHVGTKVEFDRCGSLGRQCKIS
eukprot:5264964-Pyramimonas_sp.AAC.1